MSEGPPLQRSETLTLLSSTAQQAPHWLLGAEHSSARHMLLVNQTCKAILLLIHDYI